MAPSPGSNSTLDDYEKQLLLTLEAIQVNTAQLKTAIPQEFAALSQTLAATFNYNIGPSRGTPGSGAMSGTSGLSSMTGTTDASARAALTSRAQTLGEDDGSAGRGSGSGWQSRVLMNDLGSALPITRLPGAAATTRDYLKYGASYFANKAYTRQSTLDGQAQAEYADLVTKHAMAGDISMDANGNPINFNDQPLLDKFNQPVDPNDGVAQALSKAITPATNKFGKVSDLLSSAEEGYAQGQAVSTILRKVLHPISGLRQLGYQTGAQGSSAGFLGFRSPFDPAVQAGLAQKVSQMGFALHSNVTPGQAATIYEQLYGQGWMGGQQTNAMRTAAGQIMNQNPFIGGMPQTYSMMDQATRKGQMSLQDFVGTMLKVPDAANAAHVNISQMMSDMQSLGDVNVSMGGTFGQGMQNAQAWSRITGMPAGPFGQMIQNPYVQGQTFLHTGLLPWEQGLATPYQHMEGVMGAVTMLNGIVSPGGPLTSRIGNTGFSTTVTRQQQKEALMSHLMPGASSGFIHQLLVNRRGIMAGSRLGAESQSYRDTITQYLQSNHPKELQHAYNMLGGSGHGTFGQLYGDLGRAVDSQGHKVIEDWGYYDQLRHHDGGLLGMVEGSPMSMAQAHKAAQARAMWNIRRAGDRRALEMMGLPAAAVNNLSGRQQFDAVQKLMHEHRLSKRAMDEIAKARNTQVQRYQAMNTQKFGASGNNPSGPQVTIELGPAAKKVLHLSSPSASAKASRNNGGTVTMPLPGGQPSTAPMPNVDTAGTGSVINGSQQDPNLAGYG